MVFYPTINPKKKLFKDAKDLLKFNQIDNTRLDLVIPGQNHMYLRAPSPQDRQKWLVALGSAKACVDGDSKVTNQDTAYSDPNSLYHKKSELRLYCDLMMQQVHALKSAANAEDGPEVEKINDASSLLTATCDTFIKTLEEIMKLSNSTTSNILQSTALSKNNCPSKLSQKTPKQSLTRSQSQENR
ncbi:Pleckstrin homology domain-containing family A member 3 [Eumeta japonica]|uniref:Pleckstrin homology domain-containing family A member 3 n=1 Tax=Eumeta variegata TaxID=151549 RepID=A0A4C1WXP0_EUMVA|nr:Pleckstrin homology domain-containing family A member 3 [Eumeta japonica]